VAETLEVLEAPGKAATASSCFLGFSVAVTPRFSVMVLDGGRTAGSADTVVGVASLWASAAALARAALFAAASAGSEELAGRLANRSMNCFRPFVPAAIQPAPNEMITTTMMAAAMPTQRRRRTSGGLAKLSVAAEAVLAAIGGMEFSEARESVLNVFPSSGEVRSCAAAGGMSAGLRATGREVSTFNDFPARSVCF
jgi:hypothetical protein